MDTVPVNFETIDGEISNFDHSIDDGVEDQLKSGNYVCKYPGWNFHGQVWWDNKEKKFKCQVKQYQSHIATITAENLESIMEKVSDGYGYD